MNKLKRLGENRNAFTFRFDGHAVDEIHAIYKNVLAPVLSDPKNGHIFEGKKPVRGEISRGSNSFYCTSYGSSPLLWFSTNNDYTFNVFRRFFHSLDIVGEVKGLVDYKKTIVMYCGFFVIGKYLEKEVWHVDYYEGANAYTLITPLSALDPLHGNLLYKDDNENVQQYSYKMNEAIILGDGFLHTTQSYPETGNLRVLLSLTFGTDKLEYWDVLQRTVGAQSKYVVLPCGHRLGRCTCLETRSKERTDSPPVTTDSDIGRTASALDTAGSEGDVSAHPSDSRSTRQERFTRSNSRPPEDPMNENPYDDLPYTNHPYNFSHPDHLYTIARLFGVDAPDFRTARVLELGCGPGGNALSVADRFPDGYVTAIDLSEVHIREAEAVRLAAGIRNLDLRHASILDLPQTVCDELGEFDYIICHGVYSWVSPPIREHILALCAGHLVPNGVAYVSYNTLPGWNMMRTLRDMMIYHTAHIEDRKLKAEEGARLLSFVRDNQPNTENFFAEFLKTELSLIHGTPLTYFAHEYLEAQNDPCYFHEFMASARAVDLDYLGDADLGTMYVGNFGKKVADTLTKAGDIVRTEQYMDFLRNRRFRKTLLCRSGTRFDRNLSANSVRPFHITSHVRVELPSSGLNLHEDRELTFNGPPDITTRSRFDAALLVGLSQRGGHPIGRAEWLADVKSRTGVEDENWFADSLDQTVLTLSLSNGVRLTQPAENYVLQPSEMPVASPLAQVQTRTQTWGTNRRGEIIQLGLPERVLMQYLNGQNDRAMLNQQMHRHIESGELTLQRDGNPVSDQSEWNVLLEQLIESTLIKLGATAFLVT